MPHDFAREMNAAWPRADDAGPCVLTPTTPALVKNAAIFLAMIAGGTAMAAQQASQVLRVKGLIVMVTGLVLGVTFFRRMVSGGYELSLDESGFSLGPRRYAWGEINEFTLGRGKQRNIVYFTVAGTRRSVPNMYDMSGQALVDILNERAGLRRGSGIPPALVAHPSPPAPRKTLPVWAWAAIVTVFIFLCGARAPLVDALWSLTAPANYAAHMLSDQDLANRAGHEARFLPVLLARAQGGDKSAMYFMGDLYDPTDFLCESSVTKNAATAIYWYNQALPMDDEGAERSLGILYHFGVGLTRDDVMAASLFERSVTHNDDIGDYYLGQMLEQGEGEAMNLPRAVQLEQASAAQGNAFGETELGRMYMFGIGVPQDSARAVSYWQQAAAQGYRKAQALLRQYGPQHS